MGRKRLDLSFAQLRYIGENLGHSAAEPQLRAGARVNSCACGRTFTSAIAHHQRRKALQFIREGGNWWAYLHVPLEDAAWYHPRSQETS